MFEISFNWTTYKFYVRAQGNADILYSSESEKMVKGWIDAMCTKVVRTKRINPKDLADLRSAGFIVFITA